MKMTESMWRQMGFVSIIDDHIRDNKLEWAMIGKMDVSFRADYEWSVAEVVREMWRAGYRQGSRNFRNNLRQHLEWYDVDPEMGDWLPKEDFDRDEEDDCA